MRQYILEISKHGSIYTISNFLTRATGLILIPIYTRYLTTSEYGIIANVVAIFNFFLIVNTFGMQAAWGRFFFDFKDKSNDIKIVLGNIFLFLVVYGIVINLIFSFYGKPLFTVLLPDLDFNPYVILALWTAFFAVFLNLKLTLFRVRQQSIQYGIFSFGKFLSMVVLTTIAIVIYKYGAFGKVASEFTIFLAFSIISVYLLYKDFKLKFNWQILKNVLTYAIPTIPHALAGVLMVIVDRVFLTNLKGLDSVGVYAVGFQFGSIMGIIVNSINLSWSPFFMKTASQKNDAKASFSRLTTYYVLIIIFIALIIIFFSKEAVIFFTTKSYFQAAPIVPIFIFSFVLTGFYYMMATKIFYVKAATKYISIITITSIVINIILNYYFIPEYGIFGAAWARFISLFISFIFAYLISQKYYYIKYEYKRFFILVGIGSLILFSFYLLESFSLNLFYAFSLKLVLLAFYFILLHLFKFLTKSEIKNLKEVISEMRSRQFK
jgi:O-antigen/teichoic acid export membrane protein